MPLFFIDTHNGDLVARDRDGYNLPDVATARQMAVRTLRDMAGDELPDSESRLFRVSVRDAAGSLLYSAALAFEDRWQN
ncbi:hypothetical protein DWF00_07110 [Bosea caraganae]|uniref:DUF6894 domain-containing protein n=1 Tax=Bosea caraganae TaxID=2763117 RepID=A0A370L0R6_9HYPH|nr:hypothetical protein [Bosea caraganae]RDJ20988.1 hypothetical protein DWE98_21905 [Bosea caraganae]RDJ28487.1 hypothetical protein DWF00_07110 [Bosea caraganae]